MFGILFAFARMATAAWVGAACLFVAVAIQQTTSDLDLITRSRLALMRFEYYYPTGAVLIGGSFVSILLLRHGYLKFGRWLAVLGFLAGAGAILAYDYRVAFPGVREIVKTYVDQYDAMQSWKIKHDEWLKQKLAVDSAASAPSPDATPVERKSGRDSMTTGTLLEATPVILADPIQPPDPIEPTKNPYWGTNHRHSEVVNAAQVALTFLASLMLCWPGTRPSQPTILIQKPRD